MDVLGFREADLLLEELRQALGMKSEVSTQAPKTDPNLVRVRQALETNQFASLRAADPKAAGAGLASLVEQLGVTKEAEFAPVAALIRRAGADSIPALIHGMGHPFLAVRAGSYRALQESLKASGDRLPTFDPWSKGSIRKAMLLKWEQWWGLRKSVK